jgi:hypothetical protein
MGTIAELQSKPDRSYPLLWLSNEGASLDQNYKVDNIRLTMFGRVIAGEEGQDDDASEIEVLSDMQLILLDFLNYFHQQHGQEYVTDKAAQLEHFTERTNDRTAGYSCVLELKQFYDWNKCQIPESGASIPPSVDGLTLYDFCDQSVIDRLTLTQIACLEAEFGNCADGTVNITNTDNDPIATVTVASGATEPYEIPNVDWTQSDGSPQSTPYGDTIVCTPCQIPNSISLSVSDSNPDLGDSVTITATPSAGYSPTSYTFSLPRINGETVNVVQASNVYVWTAEGNGSVTINVCSTDGTDTAANMISVDVVFPFIADEYASMSASYGLFKASDSYTGDWAQFQRQSDGAYFEVGWINDVVPDFNSLRAWAGMSRTRLTILYDSTGNGNHLIQGTQTLQFRMVEGAVKIGDEGFMWTENNNRMVVQSGGTLPPNAQAYVDVYCSFDVSFENLNTITPIMQTSVNSYCMLRGDGSSSSTAFFINFGTPTYYLNGLPSGWVTRGDVYSSIYKTGRHQVTIIGGNTSLSPWLSATIGGSQDFGRYWEGGIGMFWFWAVDTSSVREEIEEKYNRLSSLNIR